MRFVRKSALGKIPTKLELPLSLLVSAAGAVLTCSACGSKRVLTYPQSARDAGNGCMR